MAAITKTEIAKVVRKVLDAEQSDTDEATLNALQRVTDLLRDKVIPQLPDQANEEEPDSEEETRGGVLQQEAPAADPFSREFAARGYPHQPCRKGGPTPTDNAVVARIRPKLRGTMRSALNGQRICCARQLVAAVKARRMHRRAAVIAVTTAIVESALLNINKEIDHDSLGLFQQRASWGSRQNRLNPTWATNAFLNAMLQKFPRNSWLTSPIGKVCQRVQVSAYPGRYQPQAADAAIIVGALWGARSAEMVESDGDGNDVTLQAIRHVNALLTERIIPRLSDGSAAERPGMEDEPDDTASDEAESPGSPEEDASNTDVPADVTHALEVMYRNLSAEQARAVAGLFTTVSKEPAEQHEEESMLA